jgi:uncharacterized protein
MRVFIDIGHPAHVHYFRNFIQLMQANGHEFFVSARNRSIIPYLLNYFKIPWFDRGKGKNGALGKILYMFLADKRLLGKAIRFEPDVFISFASPYAAQVSWLLRKPHIVLDDTEHAKFGHMFYKPFSKVLLNPTCFYKDFGPKQIRFNSFTELFYLHPNYYKPDKAIFNLLGINPGDKYVLLRFVSWDANHDIGHSGLTLQAKIALMDLFKSRGFKLFISSESEKIDECFQPYIIRIPLEKMHDALAFSEMFVAESGTMASEAAILGTPVVYVNSLPLMGYLAEQKEAGLLFHFKNSEGVLEKVKQLIDDENFNHNIKIASEKLLKDKIDPTAFLVWFLENYPQSIQIMKDNPAYQDRFIMES